MKNCLGHNEIYRLLPGPGTGSLLLPHTENLELLLNGSFSWAHRVDRVFPSLGCVRTQEVLV